MLRLGKVAAICVATSAVFGVGVPLCGVGYKALGQELGVEALYASNIENRPDDIKRFVPDNLFAVDFVSADTGWVAGYYGTVLRTVNGGRTWDHYSLPYSDLVRRVDFLDEKTGWAVTSRGKIIRTDDGGVTWRVSYEEPGVYLRDIHFVGPEEGWAIGHEATILHTVDGGASWKLQQLVDYEGRDLPRLNGIASLNEDHLFIVGEFGVVAETIDGGDRWSVISPKGLNVTFTDVAATSTGGLAVGLGGGVAIIEANAGDDVVEQAAGGPAQAKSSLVRPHEAQVSAHLLAIDVDPSGNGVVVGQGAIFEVNPEGDLSPLPLPDAAPAYSWYGGIIRRPNTEEYIVVGGGGAIVNVESEGGPSRYLIQW